LANATAVTVQELRGDIARIDSNQDVQRKYLLKELVRVEEVAQGAMEKSKGVQEQVDSVRQQTHAMAESMTAMHKHSEELTRGLQEMMSGFRDLRFDMPNKFDDWLKVRLGQVGGTISGEQSRLRWNMDPPIPLVPPIIYTDAPSVPTEPVPIPSTSGSNPQPDGPTNPSDHTSSSSRPSSTELYRAYLHHQSSQDELVVEMDRQNVGEGTEEIENGEGGNVDMMNVEAGWNIEGSSGMAVVQGDDGMEVDNEGNGRDEESKEGSAGSGMEGNPADTPMVGLEGSLEDGEVMEEKEGNVSASTVPPSSTVATTIDDVAPLPPASPSTLPSADFASSLPAHPPSSNAPNVDLDPIEDFPPSSPDVIRAHSVDPPAGLLSQDIRLSPPSSQPTLHSPCPLPNQRRLNVHQQTVEDPGQQGPITRSRSRSRSPLPPALTVVDAPRSPRRKPVLGKPRSRLG
jgi:hypothetical protein